MREENLLIKLEILEDTNDWQLPESGSKESTEVKKMYTFLFDGYRYS